MYSFFFDENFEQNRYRKLKMAQANLSSLSSLLKIALKICKEVLFRSAKFRQIK